MVLARLCKTHTYPVWGMTMLRQFRSSGAGRGPGAGRWEGGGVQTSGRYNLSKCYTYTWFLLGFAKHIHILFGA